MITFICGQLCSGKTRYGQAMAGSVGGCFIEVGNIVREIKNSSERKLLQDSKELDEAIIKKLSEKITLRETISCNQNYVICGVRQKQILKHFQDATLLWIECPKEERKKRYVSRSRDGDTQTFEEAEAGDISLGILEVKNYIFNQNL